MDTPNNSIYYIGRDPSIALSPYYTSKYLWNIETRTLTDFLTHELPAVPGEYEASILLRQRGLSPINNEWVTQGWTVLLIVIGPLDVPLPCLVCLFGIL
jgi:hypothetical protein